MTALERDVMAWAKAKLRRMDYVFSDETRQVSRIDAMQIARDFTASEARLLARGTKMLAKKGGAK